MEATSNQKKINQNYLIKVKYTPNVIDHYNNVINYDGPETRPVGLSAPIRW